MIKPRSVAYNSLLNLGSQIVVFVVALVSIPYIIRTMGQELFGLLSILWLFVGYFNFLDLGVGQANIKFVAESIEIGNRSGAARTARVSLAIALALSIAAGLIVGSLSYIGVEHFINIGPGLRAEANIGIRLLAFCLPAVFLQGVLRGIPMVLNRFDLVNLLQALSGILQWAGTATVLFFKGTFLSVVVLTVCTRYCIAFLFLWYSIRLMPELVHRSSDSEAGHAARLLRFGGWLSLSQVLGPLITFMERFFVGNLLTLSWVTFFVVPNDAVMKLVVIPMSLTTTLYPLMSGGWSTEESKERIKSIYHRSVKYIFIIMLPIAFVGVFFGGSILRVWLGEEFSTKSSFVLALFSVGILLHSLSQFPNTAIGGLGRPDLTAKLLLIELVPYLLFCYLLTHNFGIRGTAVAWLIRLTVEAGVLFVAARRLMHGVRVTFDFSYLWKGAVLVVLGGLGIVLLKLNYLATSVQVGTVFLFLLTYAVGVWYFAFDDRDKMQVKTIVSFGNRI